MKLQATPTPEPRAEWREAIIAQRSEIRRLIAAGELAALRLAQAFDLLGDILPVDRHVDPRLPCLAKRARLIFGP
jgi:hypothetical protein